MYIQSYKQTASTTARKTNVFTQGFTVEITNKEPGKITNPKLVKKILNTLEHYDMVESARKLYSEGKTVTWEAFVKNASK